ncbi:cellulose biosynthesis protein BcsO [Erwinia pyri]|uniref:Cellulose biosynthesis protein BcsO n=1 Tax=Erwinia pyri TaxID=3062598 RepID=A0AA50HQI2_9GAMM|nr:cellulose biosynthesis protein BcsO [Erwinia sp. DE2]WLS79070.1 cellulose biosynthesis protein BcsO [Erwinia sp. DE2]
MKSYDDLQRFKEKTQTNHIEFKDMSDQTMNSDAANWAIIKQLINEGSEAALGNGQLTDIAAPQPIAGDTFTAPHTSLQALLTQPHSLRPQPVAEASVQPHSVAAFVAKPAAAQIGASLLESISASLKPVATEEPAPAEPESAAVPSAQASNSLAAANPLAAAQTVNSLAAAQAFNPLAAQTVNPLAAAQAANPLAAARTVNPLAAAQSTGPAPASSLMASLPVAPSAATTPSAAVTSQPAAAAQNAPAQPTADQPPRFRQLFSSEPASGAISKDTLLQPLLERIASCR